MSRSSSVVLPAPLRPVTPTTDGVRTWSALGEAEVGAVLFFVAVAEQVEEPRIGRHDHAGRARALGLVSHAAPRLAVGGHRDPGPHLESLGGRRCLTGPGDPVQPRAEMPRGIVEADAAGGPVR